MTNGEIRMTKFRAAVRASFVILISSRHSLYFPSRWRRISSRRFRNAFLSALLSLSSELAGPRPPAKGWARAVRRWSFAWRAGECRAANRSPPGAGLARRGCRRRGTFRRISFSIHWFRFHAIQVGAPPLRLLFRGLGLDRPPRQQALGVADHMPGVQQHGEGQQGRRRHSGTRFDQDLFRSPAAHPPIQVHGHRHSTQRGDRQQQGRGEPALAHIDQQPQSDRGQRKKYAATHQIEPSPSKRTPVTVTSSPRKPSCSCATTSMLTSSQHMAAQSQTW